jgi:hypothetical protein
MVLAAYFKREPVLLLMDIGGSILFRSGTELQCDRKPDFKVRKHYHYVRPYYDDFIRTLMEHPRVKFAIYTSITKRNAMPVLQKLFATHELKGLKKEIFDVFDQEYNSPDHNGLNHWSTKRNLKMIWHEARVIESGFGP